MKRTHLIIITIFCILTSLTACSALFVQDNGQSQTESERDIVDESIDDSTRIPANSRDDSGFRQLQADNNVASQEGLKESNKKCVDWLKDATESPQAGGYIKSLQVVSGCGDQKAVLTVDSEGQVFVWNASGGLRQKLLSLPQPPAITTFSVNGSYIGMAKGAEITVLPIKAEDGESYKLDRIPSNIASMTFAPDERSILAGSNDSKVYRWDFNPEHTLKGDRKKAVGLDRYHYHSSVVSAVAFHPYGRVFFSGDWNGGLNAWLVYGSDAYKGEYDENLFGSRFFAVMPKSKEAGRKGHERIDQIKISDNGQYMVVGEQEGMIELWQVRGLVKVATVQAHDGVLYGLAISPSGEHIATVARDGVLKIWRKQKKNERLKAFELQKEREYRAPTVRVVAFLNESLVVAGGTDGLISLYDIGRAEPEIVQEEIEGIDSDVSIKVEEIDAP